jgi:hypothetical protein
MHIWITRATAGHKAQKIGLAAAILVASVGAVAADERYAPGLPGFFALPPLYEGSPFSSPYFANQFQGLAPSREDRNIFNRSGSRGRMGLGASPIHPEGAGNDSN